MKLLFFAALAEISGVSEITITDSKDTDELKDQVLRKFPRLNGLTFSVAVNKSIVQGNVPLTDTDEVALLPPFSGG